MTSIPASRRPRATTFAPRSWPSSPAFATTTRIGRFGRAVSEVARVAIGAIDLLERRAHLAQRRVGARALQEARHEVLVTLRCVAQRVHRRLPTPRVALAAHFLDTRDLALLDRGGDPQDRHGSLLVGRELVDAHDHAPARL